MPFTGRCLVLGLVAFAVLGRGPAWADPPGSEGVGVKVVKYPEMLDWVKHLRGRVLVVDFWADTCLICKKEFPRLVQMHQKHASEGLAAISVSLDDPSQPGAVEKVQQFLKSQPPRLPISYSMRSPKSGRKNSVSTALRACLFLTARARSRNSSRMSLRTTTSRSW